jgi:DNA primase
VVLFFDSDAAGQKASERALEILFGAGLQVKLGELPPGEDPDSLIRKSGGEAFRSQLELAEDFFDFHVKRNLDTTKTTASRVAFARKMSQFISAVPEPVLRDILISRLASLLAITRDALSQMIFAQKKPSGSRTLDEEVAANTPTMPPHRLALICKASLLVPDLLQKIRRQPWEAILKQVDGADLLVKIFSSDLVADEPSSIAKLFAGLPQNEAAALSAVLANKELNEQMGEKFWIELAQTEIRRRKQHLENVKRLTSEDPVANRQAVEEFKEILDLESRFTDISRLPSRAP